MKQIATFVPILLSIVYVFIGHAQQTCSPIPQRPSPGGCTVFTVSKGKQVFFGRNDDYINPDSYYWIDPGGAQGYGPIWIGTSLPGGGE